MKPRERVDLPLIIGLAIPVVMIVVFAAVIGVFRLVHGIEGPRHDFLYSVGSGDEYHYLVRDGRLQRRTLKPTNAASGIAVSIERRFFIHHVRANTSEEVSYDRASALSLDSRTRSPDGFRLATGTRSRLFPICWSRDYRYRYLKKTGLAMRLDFENVVGFGYPPNMTFLGWIEE